MRDDCHDDEDHDRWIGDPDGEGFEAALNAGEAPYDARLPHVPTVLGPIPPAALGLTVVTRQWPGPEQAPAIILADLEAAYALGLRAIWVSNAPGAAQANDLHWLAARAPIHLIAGSPAGDDRADALDPVVEASVRAWGGNPPQVLPIAGADTYAVRGVDGSLSVAIGDQIARLAPTADAVAAAWAAGDDRWLAGFASDPVSVMERLPLALMGAGLPAVAVRRILVENPMAALTIVPADSAHR